MPPLLVLQQVGNAGRLAAAACEGVDILSPGREAWCGVPRLEWKRGRGVYWRCKREACGSSQRLPGEGAEAGPSWSEGAGMAPSWRGIKWRRTVTSNRSLESCRHRRERTHKYMSKRS